MTTSIDAELPAALDEALGQIETAHADIDRLSTELDQAHQVVAALVVERGRLAEERDAARQALDLAAGPYCEGCGELIDPDTCHCGEAADAHNAGSGHSPWPMGCACHLDVDWPRVATARRVMLAHARGDLVRLRDRVAALEGALQVTTAERDALVMHRDELLRLVAKLTAAQSAIAVQQ